MPVLQQNEVFAGRYLLDQLIGEGGFSEVWTAKDQMADDALVAIKIYAPGQGLDEWGLRQFKNEFSLTHHFSHPHLLKVNHYDVADGAPYLIMTYCPYGSLGDGLRKSGVYCERQVALVMCQVGSALAEIHSQHPAIIHQDIKPDNILLMQPETFMLADFGISSRIRNTLSKTTATIQALTVAYAPPERFDHRPTASAASDIFSLGVTLYEMCTNEVPWEGSGGACLLNGARVPALPAGFSPGLSKILEACMSADPGKRPTAAEIHEKGRRYLESGQWNSAKQKRELLYANKMLVSLLATVAVALVATAGMVFYNLDPKTLPEKPIETATAPRVTGKPLVEVNAPAEEEINVREEIVTAPKDKSINSKQDKTVAKSAQALEPARKITIKQAPGQQKMTTGLRQGRQEQASEESVAKAPIPAEETIKVTPTEVQPAPAASQPVVTTPQPLPGERTATVVSHERESSSSKIDRPSTGNTTIKTDRQPWFKSKPKFQATKKSNAHQKRVKKLKRRYS